MGTASGDWELTKENIQPIQRGRKPGVLKAALAVHPESKHLQQQQQDFEQQLRAYDGDDPLNVWDKYIKWVEQNYPKGGREGNIAKLIHQCLSCLSDTHLEKYKDDDRFIDIWLKYANIVVKPIEVYDNMFQRNIGCHAARFYINWAWELEQIGNLKQADKVIQTGIQKGAEPLSTLQSVQLQLEARMVKKFGDDLEHSNNDSDERSAFAILKPEKHGTAPINRVGLSASKPCKQNMIISKPLQSIDNTKPFKIYSADNQETSLPTQSEGSLNFLLHADSSKENEKRASKWTDVKVKQNSKSVTKAPEFAVHRDESPQKGSARKLPQTSHVLSSRKQPLSPLPFIFEPPDPKKRPMYNKIKVYGGAEEFSFEEIRAAQWFEKQKRLEAEKKEMERIKTTEILMKKLMDMEAKISNLEKKTVSNESKTSSSETETQEHSHSSTHIASSLNSATEERERNCHIDKYSKSECTEKCQPVDVETPPLNKLNVVDVMVQELYNGSFMEPEKDDVNYDITSNNLIDGNSDYYKSANYVSSNMPYPLLNNFKVNSNQVFAENKNLLNTEQPQKKIPFSFYYDPTDIIPLDPAVSSAAKVDKDNIDKENVRPCENSFKENKLPSAFENIESDENDENIPPPDYIQQHENRELAGILQPSKNVFYMTLEDQLANEQDDDDDDNEDDRIPSVVPPDDFTLTALNDEQFAAAAPFSSTPYIKAPAAIKKRETEINAAELTSLPIEISRPAQLSTILETSREGTSKSSSSCSSGPSLTRLGITNHISQYSTKEHSKSLAAAEPNILTEVCNSSNNNIQKSNVVLKNSEYKEVSCVDIDPFDQALTAELLKNLKVPVTSQKNYYKSNNSINNIKVGVNIKLGNVDCVIESLHAEGAYAKIYSAQQLKEEFNFDENQAGIQKLAIKVCMKVNNWEFYICSELHQRLKAKNALPDVRNSIMNINTAVSFQNGIVLISDLCEYGTLLDLVNAYKQNRSYVPECVTMYLTLEMLQIVSEIHSCGILHADVKPDNFLVNNIPSVSEVIDCLLEKTSCLRLIDFGRAIDLHHFKDGISFTRVVNTKCFKCTEMKEGRPWVYQIDWFGVLGCIHVLLFTDYMTVHKNKNGHWEPVNKFKRYWQVDLWQPLFHSLLNIPSCYEVPDLKPFIHKINEKLHSQVKDFRMQMAEVLTYLKRK